MKKLIEGIHQFQSDVFPTRKSLFEDLAKGQKPVALFITCSDSRICPNLLTQTEPGELFVLRNAGNLVPPYGTDNGAEAATIEYAVEALGVKDIIVCGHSHCGAMAALLEPSQAADLPAVRSWLSHADTTRRKMDEDYSHLTDSDARVMATVQKNVLVQLDHLRTHPAVHKGVEQNELSLHGWLYTFETGQILQYDLGQGQFVPLD